MTTKRSSKGKIIIILAERKLPLPRADRIAMLHEGRIIWDGPVADIDGAGNDYVDQFIR